MRYGLLVAAVLGYFLFGLVIQVSDSFGNLLAVQPPTLGELVRDQFSQRAYLRPLLWAQLKIVYELSGGNYFLWFRGIHVAQVLLLIVLYLRLVRPRTALDAALVPLSLALLIGAHTFVPMVREAFPINGFLTMAVVLRGGGDTGPSGAVPLVLGPSGHRAVRRIAAHGRVRSPRLGDLCGRVRARRARPVAARGAGDDAVPAGVSSSLATFVLDVGTPSLAERASGFGFRMLEPSDLMARFEGRAWPFYVYNVAQLDLDGAVLGAERWRVAIRLRADHRDDPSVECRIGGLVDVRRRRSSPGSCGGGGIGFGPGVFDDNDRLVGLFLVVLVANAVISFPYTKNVIMSPAGVFLGLAVSVAAREWFRDARPSGARAVPTLVLFAVLTCGWAYRVAGNHYNLRWTAAEQRAAWVSVDTWLDRQRIALRGADGPALRDALRRDALWNHPTPYQPPTAWTAWFDIDW